MSSARDAILDATCDLLELQGYHATGMNQIIKTSGSPKGSLYHYFPGGKEELTEEALNRVGAAVEARIQAQLAAHTDPVIAVREFIHMIARGVEASGYRMGGPITTVAMETAATSDRLRHACAKIYASWQAAVEARLISGGSPPETAQRRAALIVAAIEGGIILCRTQRSPQPLHAIADEMAQLLRIGGAS